jgi:hypothetical protein
MRCEVVQTPLGVGFICGPGRSRAMPRCRWCSAASTRLCDFQGPRAKRTCDAPMCDLHARRVGDELDHCPLHAAPAAGEPSPLAPLDEQWAAETLEAVLEHLRAHAKHCEACGRWVLGHGRTIPR